MNRPKPTIVMLDELIKFAAEAHTEVASTEHPVKNIDDGTEPNKEGAPAAEKTKDVKDMVGDASVDAQAKSATIRELLRKKAEGGGQTPSGIDQVAGGIYRAGGDEDPKVNTAALKGGHSEPGTKHPAAMDNSAINSNKYGSANTAALVAALRKQASEAGALLAGDLSKTPGPVVPPVAAAPAAPAAPAKTASASPAPSVEAMLLDGSITKEAADRLVVAEIAAFVKEAHEDATALATMLRDTASQYKIANDPMMPPMDGGTGAPPADMGGLPPMDGGGMSAPPMDGGMGGAPAPGGDMGGAPGGDPLEQLIPLIEQATPKQLEQIIQVLSGGGEAPPAPAAPADAAPPSAPPAESKPKAESKSEGESPKDDSESKEASLTTAKVIREILSRK